MEPKKPLHSSGRKKLGIFVASDEFGGAERYIGLLVDALRSETTSIIIIGRLKQPTLPDVARRTVRVGPKWSRRALVESFFRLISDQRAYLREASKDDLTIAHLQFKREQILLSKRLSEKIPVVWTEHGILPGGPYGFILRYFYRRASRHVALILCVSHAVVDELHGIGIPMRKLRLAENPVNVKKFYGDDESRTRTRRELNIREDQIALLVMSRLDRHKGIHRIIEAMDLLPENFMLLVAGSGPADTELRRQGEGLGERIRFLGFRDDPVHLLRASDIFCFPSTSASGEGVPTMAVLEALACSVPVVATPDSGLDCWLPGRGGLVATDGADGLARSIELAYQRRDSLGNTARSTALEYDISKWKLRQNEWLEDVLS